MNIELYRTFLAISDSRSFTAAAQQPGRTQSAVSQQTKRLEEALGPPLFERHSGAVDLIEYGKSLITYLNSVNHCYRIACVCRSVHAQHAAITAGLCAAVLVEGSMVEGERAYLEEDGFPVLKHLTIRLERSRAKKSQVIDRLEEHFLEYFART